MLVQDKENDGAYKLLFKKDIQSLKQAKQLIPVSHVTSINSNMLIEEMSSELKSVQDPSMLNSVNSDVILPNSVHKEVIFEEVSEVNKTEVSSLINLQAIVDQDALMEINDFLYEARRIETPVNTSDRQRRMMFLQI